MARINIILLLIVALTALASASNAPTFCKCTCFKNSTIIPLGPQHRSEEASTLRRASLPLDSRNHNVPRSASTSCSQCTKAFCLSQGIDFCKKAEEDDVVTMCFQRDSNKDKIIVWGFIFGVVGLLGWSAVRRVIELRQARSIGQQGVNYTPVSEGR